MTRARRALFSAALLLAVWQIARLAVACPFCNAVKPTFAQQRESATVVALGELAAAKDGRRSYRLHQVLHGKELLDDPGRLKIAGEDDLSTGALVLLLAHRDEDHPLGRWTQLPVNEISYAYFARAPDLRKAPAERLRYFARYLEHADPQIAEDAYLEFAHAPYDQVAEVADALDPEKLRAWLLDVGVLDSRKGFYAVALGLAGDERQRRESARLLRRLIEEADNDFTSGFDGVLGGYLVGEGEDALKLIERRFLADPRAADGHVRHAAKALRFYYEFGREIPKQRLAAALRHLLARPEFAATTVVDLARWQDWTCLERVAGLFGREAYDQPAVDRAIVGYLHVCPRPEARRRLEQLRQKFPDRVARAEAQLDLAPGGQ